MPTENTTNYIWQMDWQYGAYLCKTKKIHLLNNIFKEECIIIICTCKDRNNNTQGHCIFKHITCNHITIYRTHTLYNKYTLLHKF